MSYFPLCSDLYRVLKELTRDAEAPPGWVMFKADMMMMLN